MTDHLGIWLYYLPLVVIGLFSHCVCTHCSVHELLVVVLPGSVQFLHPLTSCRPHYVPWIVMHYWRSLLLPLPSPPSCLPLVLTVGSAVTVLTHTTPAPIPPARCCRLPCVIDPAGTKHFRISVDTYTRRPRSRSIRTFRLFYSSACYWILLPPFCSHTRTTFHTTVRLPHVLRATRVLHGLQQQLPLPDDLAPALCGLRGTHVGSTASRVFTFY